AFSEASATQLPFPDRSFDVVITWTVLQHLPNSLVGKALSEIKRVANPKSLLILCESTLHAGKPETRGQHTHDRFPEFYAEEFSPRSLIVSEFITELDRIPSMGSPGRLMVFGPVEQASADS
ncbi:MAG TPA: class I SAM-dependent methyltransferase, partial [Acidobacteriaceae bacterium]|nr:class I SAM-dependent methyltransferase [Acidobacteriaceae bacterium]